MVAAALSPMNSHRLQPHLSGDVKKFVGVVGSSRTPSGFEGSSDRHGGSSAVISSSSSPGRM
jgi:hypothetical protein